MCEVYRLHRETFFLAADFIDRYMTARDDVQKYQLQLIGVTALFIAAKIEVSWTPPGHLSISADIFVILSTYLISTPLRRRVHE